MMMQTQRTLAEKKKTSASLPLLALLALLLMALLSAQYSSLALAQQGPVTATGVLVGPVEDGDQDPTPKYTLSDEATGTNYVLISGFVELEPFAGERVTIAGVPIGGADNAPPALNVTRIEPAEEDEDPASPSEKATLSFELTVEGEPPTEAEFLGLTATESLSLTPLVDPDGDGTYTGSTSVVRFAPGGPPEPVSVSPVQIVQGPPTGYTANGPQYRVIKDFGPVKLDEDKTLTASVSFPGDGGSDNNGGSGNSGSGSGSGSVSGSGPGGISVLPFTGGTLPVAGIAGALLIGGGLLIHRLAR
ncbi:hypothetical protein BH24ACT19_BH24ACT19_03390 [soil metagenome]